MSDHAVDVSGLALSFRDRPILSAATDLLRASGGDMGELRDFLADVFAPGAGWCEVGQDIHTIGRGDFETRLHPRTDGWHATFFAVGWSNAPFSYVPVEHRADIATYVDRAEAHRQGLLQEDDLRAAAAEGGGPAVDCLVQEWIGRLDAWHAGLDGLIAVLASPERKLPGWARAFVWDEVERLNTAREWLTSAVTAYHHGTAGQRPDTLFGGVRYDFSTGSVELLRAAPREPSAVA